MSSAEIVRLINIFNLAAVCVTVLFAFLALLAAAGKRFGRELFPGKVLFGAFCAAALGALAAEATFFNFPSYLRFFAGPTLRTTDVSEDGSGIINTTGGISGELVVEKDSSGNLSSGVRFRNLDRNVTSIFADLVYSGVDEAQMLVRWTDEANTRQFKKTLHGHLPHENNTPLQPSGKVSELTIMFSAFSTDGVANPGMHVRVNTVALNEPIPFYFSGARLLVVTLLLFACVALARRKSRERAFYWLFEYRFDPASIKQRLVYALAAALLIIFSWAAAYTSVPKRMPPGTQQYNRFLVDALIAGRAHLSYGNPEKLLNAERPYDIIYLTENGYERDVDWMWDWAWYNGKHYSYFGVVPAVILFAPYKIVTGEYLTIHAGIFILVAVTVVLLAMLWRLCVKRYMPDARFAFCLLSFAALYFGSGLFAALRFPFVYFIAQTSGLMFSVAGALLLLKSIENDRVDRLKLFFACLCFALVAGCRPNMIFTSLLVPALLWKYRSWKLLAFVSIPYIIVAIPLCAYNYVRFESIFEFGAQYNLTSFNVTNVYELQNPFAAVLRLFKSAAYYLFLPVVYSPHFPFVECLPRGSWMTLGAFQYSDSGAGLVCFPIVICLLHLFRNISNPKVYLPGVFLAVGVVIMLANSLIVGFVGRYTLDFAVFVLLPSLFCARYWCGSRDGDAPAHDFRLKLTYVTLAVTILTGLFLFVGGHGSLFMHKDPALFRYLEYSFGIFRPT